MPESVLLNYYEILGLSTNAGIPEIKAAFRQLAKIYHPDLNPEGKEHFTQILKAYEVLSDPGLKYKYDYRLNSQTKVQETPKPQKEKNWRFDEREMKRRQYYNDHIKKYEKKSTERAEEVTVKSGYNEFKYILFATPLAVALFLGIMSLASRKKHNPEKSLKIEKTAPVSDLKMGDSPFVWYFGKEQFYPSSKAELTIRNISGSDAVILLFSEDKFIRSCFITDGYSADISQLPASPVEIRYSTGKEFAQSLKLEGTTVTGGFQSQASYYSGNGLIPGNKINQLTLLAGLNEGFKTVSPAEFFSKQQ